MDRPRAGVAEGGWSGYSDQPMGGAYTNVIAFAPSASQFRTAAVTALDAEGFSVDEI